MVDGIVAPRRDNFGFAAPTDFQLSGFYLDDGAHSSRSEVQVRDPQTGQDVKLKVIGVLSDVGAARDGGDLDLAEDARGRLPGRVPTRRSSTSTWRREPTPRQAATQLESAFLANGMEAESLEQVMRDVTAGVESRSTG